MSIKVIGLSGKAGTGKDYIAKHYLQPIGYVPIALADGVKEMVVARGLCTPEEAFVTKPPQVRTALQLIGTEEIRTQWGEDYWCRQLAARIFMMHQRWGVSKFVVTDVRFPNEVHFIQDVLNGEVYRLYAPDRHAALPLTEEQRQHSSETSLDIFDPIEDELRQGRLVFGTTVVEVVNGRQQETSLFDAVIDNRLECPPLDQQMTQILRLHDHIAPTDVAIAVP